MQFGISTHLYHDLRLEQQHLAQVASYGFEEIELFATRSHFDYRDPAAIDALAEWLAASGLTLRSVHAPITDRFGAGDQWAPTFSNASSDAALRQATVDETGAALAIARRIPFSVLVVHLGTPESKAAAADNNRGAAARSVEEICRLAEPLGIRVAFEVIPNALSSPSALATMLDRDTESPIAGICLDFGHAFLGGDVPDAVETVAEHLPQRRAPAAVSRRDRVGRGADVDAENRLRRHLHDGTGEHGDAGGGLGGRAARPPAV
jgi:sugar phosphate isomerase/epimerase